MSRSDVAQLVQGPGVAIFDACVVLCHQLVLEHRAANDDVAAAGHRAAPNGSALWSALFKVFAVAVVLLLVVRVLRLF